ncbi:GntR family transcriptional regulator [Mycolicibacterium sp.]|uniref:FadR/GntR family transcriptional regulator n=1 Tax=Mycolicibacterium sp. TaxID=2320850 RepID=UPI001A34EBBC|nr:GntR family transcriptional regulator [Mycolicibacterium sp.]MBJ7336416.1 FadR family transcriptional regulator [Mycolicibacterium sp.]
MYPRAAGPSGRRSSVVSVPKASALIAANLRRRIVMGDLTPGQTLPSETTLMAEFGVSRPTLREAFRILEAESIITVVRGPRGGAKVLEPDGSMAARYTGTLLQYRGTPLSDLYRARTEIEVSAVGMIAVRGTGSVRPLRDLVLDGDGIVDDEEAFADYSLRFHLAVVETAGSTTLAVLARMLFEIVETHNALFIASHEPGFERPVNKTAQRAYRKLVKLLQAGDGAAAQRHWRRHLEAVERFMVGQSDATLVEVLS